MLRFNAHEPIGATKAATIVSEMAEAIIRAWDRRADYVRFQGRVYTRANFKMLSWAFEDPSEQREGVGLIETALPALIEHGRLDVAMLVEILRDIFDWIAHRYRPVNNGRPGTLCRIPDMAILFRAVLGDHEDLDEEPETDARFDRVEEYLTLVTDKIAAPAELWATHFKLWDSIYERSVFKGFADFVNDRTQVREFTSEILAELDMWHALGFVPPFTVPEALLIRLKECLAQFFEPSHPERCELLRTVRVEFPSLRLESAGQG